ncbi:MULTISPECIES: type II toxin-antitoxin system HicA family toxin [Leptotrichia]|jgi:conserved domain protein|uniref:YcfA-like protein n=1 Tax=Leptotrichia wadei TaxID=157687 RepID=A0A510KTM6_9FUSO|nr:MULTISPECIES: type II toxin-antitoxin system HicA family toxin [Leptotrichia]NWO27016.1 type II toxin-antitoxin system HicA family toxin [Leptotrichia sp. oral taxon 417]BBM54597.1 YcfA-like protein [Leptotrichia wadei]
MSRTKPYRSVVKVLKKNGWELDHTTGSHEIYIKNGKICPLKCTKKDIPSGTLTNIERITGLKF